MTIRFQCDNLVRFDPETQQYVKCGHELSVDASLAADTIECPECGNSVEVPVGLGNSARSIETKPNRTQPRPVLSNTASASPGQPTATPQARRATSTIGSQRAETAARRATNSVAPNPTSKTLPGVGSSQGSIDDAELGTESRTLHYASFDPNNTCLTCGGQVVPSMSSCPHCGAARRVIPQDRPLESYEVKPAGMQLWWRGTMNSETSRGFFVKGMGFIVVWTASCFCAISIFLMGIFSFIVTVPVTGVVIAYFASLLRLRKMMNKPGLQLWSWQRLIWKLLVPVFRSISWKFTAFPNPTVLTLRGANLVGKDLHEHTGIQQHNVIDLAGCEITDQELRTLYHTKHIRALVLIGTQVTPEGVFRLQQETPRTWMWY